MIRNCLESMTNGAREMATQSMQDAERFEILDRQSWTLSCAQAIGGQAETIETRVGTQFVVGKGETLDEP